jgi:hypothetical protein
VGNVTPHAPRGHAVAALVARHDACRPVALAALALISAAGYGAMWRLMPAALAGHLAPVALLQAALLVPYGATTWLLLATGGPRAVRWRRVEWATLVGGTLLFRALLLPLPPVLSRDAYRYAWDALLTSHGLSPYLHAPDWHGFDGLRHPAFYNHVPWKTVPTIYPPVAQLLYRLAYLVAPENVWGIKAEMAGFDLLAGGLLALLLVGRGLDPRRAFIYLWAPLTVVEFALNAHVDAAAIAFTLLALLANGATFRGARAVVGILLGIATLIKLYPLVLVLALVRRRDWALVVALAVTLGAGYAPFWRDGLAAFGFLSTYLTQVHDNFGGALLLIRAVAFWAGLNATVVRAAGVLGAALGAAAVCWLRVRRDAPAAPHVRAEERRGSWRAAVPTRLGIVGHLRLDPAGASGALIVLWLVFSPHVFAWYVTALVPFCALFLAWPPRRLAAALAIGVWTFTGLIPLSYVAFETPSLTWLYPALYVAALVAALAALIWRHRTSERVAAGLPATAQDSPLPLSIQKGRSL